MDTVEKIKLLYKTWKHVDPASVDLGFWACGTYACLAGHAGMVPVFNEMGFTLKDFRELPEDAPDIAPVFKGLVGFGAVNAFFTDAAVRLFYARDEDYYDRNLIDYDEDVTDHELARRRMARWLANHGVDVGAL